MSTVNQIVIKKELGEILEIKKEPEDDHEPTRLPDVKHNITMSSTNSFHQELSKMSDVPLNLTFTQKK